VIKGLRTVIYKVPDLVRAKAWYRQAFEIEPYFDEPFYVGFNVGGFELGLDPAMTDPPARGGVVAYWGVDDIDRTFAHFLAAGAVLHEAPHEVGGEIKVASVLDPFGNVVGLIFNPHFEPTAVR
jgi:lactoylglutathione lyase